MTWSQNDGALTLSAEALAQIAAYAGLPLAGERAGALAPLLTGPLAVVRALQPAGYDDLQPATAYRVPPAPPAGAVGSLTDESSHEERRT